MNAFKLSCVALIALVCAAWAAPASAADALDLNVGLKTLPLLNNRLSGTAVMALIYDAASAQAKAEAESLKSVIDAGLEAPGGVRVTAVMVPSSELNRLSGAQLGFIVSNSCSDAVGAAAASYGVLTMTTDIGCVRAGKSVLGLISRPNVEIFYSRAAAAAARVNFSLAFAMVVKQV